MFKTASALESTAMSTSQFMRTHNKTSDYEQYAQPQDQRQGCWGEPVSRNAAMDCHQSKTPFQPPARQASGASPSSALSSGCAMEYSCNPAQQLHGADSDSLTGMGQGWFSKCRGCGCMTAHEQLILGAEVPFCRRCQATLDNACPGMKAKMVDTLLYVHQAWSSAGL